MENPPQPEKPESSFKTSPSTQEGLLRYFRNFRARPDTPKYTYEEQNRIGELMEIKKERFEKEKTPEAEKEFKELIQKFQEGKMDKKHISAIWAPLLAAQLFLQESEEAKKIPVSVKNHLLEKINALLAGVKEAQQKEDMSDELVAEVLRFMDEMESRLR